MYSSPPFFSREMVEGNYGDARLIAMDQLQRSSEYYDYNSQQNHLIDGVFDITQSGCLPTQKLPGNIPTMAGANPMQFGALTQQTLSSLDMEIDMGGFSFMNSNIDNLCDSTSGIATTAAAATTTTTSPHTETSTDVDHEERHEERHHPQLVRDDTDEMVVFKSDSIGDPKAIRRLSQNREAARRSRLRKKAYVRQLENSRLKLIQLEHELICARQQGVFISGGSVTGGGGGGTKAFDLDHARWIEEHQRLISELRSAVANHHNSQTGSGDGDLKILVDVVMAHYDEVFRMKSLAVKSDVFHVLSGMWVTPAERCFMWLGGFRSSELLKVVMNHVEPMTEQQMMGICNLQQSSQQGEDALSQGMEALQMSLTETLGCCGSSLSSEDVGCYMSVMATAMRKLSATESFLLQADLLRQQTLHQMHRILTTRQAARGFLAVSDYFTRLRALSSLWLARPRE